MPGTTSLGLASSEVQRWPLLLSETFGLLMEEGPEPSAPWTAISSSVIAPGYGSSYTENMKQRPSPKEAAMRMLQLPVQTLLKHAAGCITQLLPKPLYHHPELGIGQSLQPSLLSSFVKGPDKSSPCHHFNPDTSSYSGADVELELPNYHPLWLCKNVLLPWRRTYKTTGKTAESVHHLPSWGRRTSPHPRSSPECWTTRGMSPHQ